MDNEFFEDDEDFWYDPIFRPSDSTAVIPLLPYPSSSPITDWYTTTLNNEPLDWDDESNAFVHCHTLPNPEHKDTYTWEVELTGPWPMFDDLDGEEDMGGDEDDVVLQAIVMEDFDDTASIVGEMQGYAKKHIKSILLLLLLVIISFLLPATPYKTIYAFLKTATSLVFSLFASLLRPPLRFACFILTRLLAHAQDDVEAGYDMLYNIVFMAVVTPVAILCRYALDGEKGFWSAVDVTLEDIRGARRTYGELED
ncbi:hypothetical protein HDV00_004881 [Rhizophlyctis rosea]|nr:hypothetical protein HDV00_004881 [Rhizophlyctis rosea]